MVKLKSGIGRGAARYLMVAALGGALVSCGGGSGDGKPLGERDLDGDGVINSEDQDSDGDGELDATDSFIDWDGDGRDDDRSNQDLDNDNIPNGQDSDSDGDGIDDEDDNFIDWNGDGFDDTSLKTQEEANQDSQGGFTAVSAANPCGSDTIGTDNNSSNNNWGDNCEVKRSSKGGQFADSSFSIGIQRVLFCKGFAEASETDYTVFADGEFGPKSEAALIRFQQSIPGFDDDGIVGPLTWVALQNQIELLNEGQAGVSPDAWGFTTGACAGIPMFYQDTTPAANDQVILGGWSLAKNTPKQSERSPFSYVLVKPD